ncbi:MAG: hypothetical protein DHS20C13_29350 [Thermodesulfobacteriota bacterium]|nr:MAG: hypothetical protein DHS20C13_29350 [Thermodesulfobacteriota bacterium]GJM36621.1 MAG: hypothetical protein DHS20C18_56220 [Saprospiraceae bacterium]
MKIEYLLLMFFGLGIINSCADECDNVVCLNGGICDNGECFCPNGFSGIDCEIEDVCITHNIDCQNGGTCLDGLCDCLDGYLGTNCERFDSTKVQDLLDGGRTPLELVNGNIPIDSLYGKFYKGGLIFYVDVNDEIDGIEGMVAAMDDSAVWGCSGTDIVSLNNVPWNGGNLPDGIGAEIGHGFINTSEILTACTTNGIASKLCRDFGNQWFLPSIKELDLMYTNLDQNGYGDFANDEYWSSTEYDADFAWSKVFKNDFSNGFLALIAKFENLHVRAAKSF